MSILIRSLVFSFTLGVVGLGVLPGTESKAQAFWLWNWLKSVAAEPGEGGGGKGGTRAVPELDPNAAVQAVALLAGGTYLVLRRRREA